MIDSFKGIKEGTVVFFVHKSIGEPSKMCKEEPAPKEPVMVEEEEEQQQQSDDGDGLAQMIALIMKTILQEEMVELAASMVDFRKSLSHHMLAEERERKC